MLGFEKKLLLSSNANNGSNASLGNFNSNNGVGNSNANVRFQTYCVYLILILKLPTGGRGAWQPCLLAKDNVVMIIKIECWYGRERGYSAPPLIEDSLNNPQAYEKIRIFA